MLGFFLLALAGCAHCNQMATQSKAVAPWRSLAQRSNRESPSGYAANEKVATQLLATTKMTIPLPKSSLVAAAFAGACSAWAVWYCWAMSLEEIKTEMARMPQEQQDQLAAYLVHLRHQRDPRIREEITTSLNDPDPAKWVSLGELREKWKTER